jgi:DNA invertase Pin-like site-specific DNA recombinase
MPSTAYSYLRLSRKHQTKGHGKDRQWELTVQACTEHNWQLSEQTFKDLGKSAYTGKNQESGSEFRTFLDLINAGGIAKGSILIVENPDRLSRQDVMTSVRLMQDILSAGISIYTIFDKRLYSTNTESQTAFMDLMFWGMQAQRAYDESHTKSLRLLSHKASQRDKARSGSTGLIGKTPAWIDTIRPKDGQPYYALNQPRAETIRNIFKLKLEGHTPTAIAKLLQAQGLPTWSNTVSNWSDYTIRRWLCSPSTYGQLQLMKKDASGASVADGDPIESYYPAVISRETFVAVQQVTNKTVRGRINLNGINLFRGLLKCSCGSSLHVQVSKTRNGRKIPYIRCSGAYTTSPCPRPAFDYAQFEYFIGEGLQQINWESLYTHRSGVSQTELEQTVLTLDAIEVDISDTEVRIATILDNLEVTKGSAAGSLIERLTSNQDKLANLKQRQQDLTKHKDTLTNQVAASTDTLETMAISNSYRSLLRAMDNMSTMDEVNAVRLKVQMELKRQVGRIDISLEPSGSRWSVVVYDNKDTLILNMSLNKQGTTAYINHSTHLADRALIEIYRSKIDYRSSSRKAP